MRTNARLFWGLAVFFAVVTVIYVAWSLLDPMHAAIEWAGTFMLALSALLAAFIGFYLGKVYTAQGGEAPRTGWTATSMMATPRLDSSARGAGGPSCSPPPQRLCSWGSPWASGSRTSASPLDSSAWSAGSTSTTEACSPAKRHRIEILPTFTSKVGSFLCSRRVVSPPEAEEIERRSHRAKSGRARCGRGSAHGA